MFIFFYYLILFFLLYLFVQTINNKFIRYFFSPVLLGIFGSFWFIEPGSNNIAPIISIMFLEASILEPNGTDRLIRPLVSFIFLLELISLLVYFGNKKILRKK